MKVIRKENLFLGIFSLLIILGFSSCNPYFKNYYSNIKMSGYIIKSTEPIYYHGKDGEPLPFGFYFFIPEKYVKTAKNNVLILKKNPIFYVLEIKSSKEQYLIELQRKYIYNNGKNYTWYTYSKILYKKGLRQKYRDYNIKGYNISLNSKDIIDTRINWNFFLVEILE
jgi:hypothetical protein